MTLPRESTPSIRPITVDELAEHLAHGWTCARCQDEPTHVVEGLEYRLCAVHADAAVREWQRMGLVA